MYRQKVDISYRGDKTGFSRPGHNYTFTAGTSYIAVYLDNHASLSCKQIYKLACCVCVTGSSPLKVINHYYTYLEGHMDADSVSHMMHSKRLITDNDYEAITTAPNDINMNRLLLQYVRVMDMPNLSRFCDVLKSIETQHCIGVTVEACT